MLESIVNHYQDLEKSRQDKPVVSDLTVKNDEIKRLRREIIELHSNYETTIMRLKNLVDEATDRASKMESLVGGLRREIAVLQVEQKNLLDAVNRKGNKARQYYEIAMMQLEETSCLKQK